MSPARGIPRLPATCRAAALVLLCAAPAAASEPRGWPVFSPVSPPAEAIADLFYLVLAIAGVIFVGVQAALFFLPFRYRERAGDGGREPPQIYGSLRLEIAWTVGPLLIVFVLFLVVIRTVVASQPAEAPKGSAVHVRVTAHQWWWQYDYPELDVHTANELHVPVSDAEHQYPVLLELVSADVVHSYWVPQLAGKTDVIPGRVNRMWFAPTKPGLYRGQCAEYCGMQHAGMLIRVIAEPYDEFQKWAAHQRLPAVNEPSQRPGQSQFFSKTCFNCHTIRGTLAAGTVGPDLTHLMSRQTIASCTLPNDREHLTAWLRDPQALKPGCKMPDLKLSARDVQVLVDYLETLK